MGGINSDNQLEDRDSLIGKDTTPLLSEGNLLDGNPASRTVSADCKRTSSASSTDSFRQVSSRIIRSLSSTQREHALRDLGVGPAAFLIKDAVLGYQDAPWYGWYDPYENPHRELRNLVSVVSGRLVANNYMNWLLIVANWVLFGLSFIEPPHWCRDSDLDIVQNRTDDSLQEFGDCKVILNARGTAADGTPDVDLYPNSRAMILSVTQSQNIELVCIGIIAAFALLELGRDGFEFHLFFYPGLKRWLHFLRCVLIALLVVGIVVKNVAFGPCFRMLLLATHLRRFQSELFALVKMVSR
jgi:hypothetical protein